MATSCPQSSMASTRLKTTSGGCCLQMGLHGVQPQVDGQGWHPYPRLTSAVSHASHLVEDVQGVCRWTRESRSCEG